MALAMSAVSCRVAYREATRWEDISFGALHHERASVHSYLAPAEALKAPSHNSTTQQLSCFSTLSASCSKPQAEALLFVLCFN